MHFRITYYTICYLLLSIVYTAVRVLLSNNNRNLNCGQLSSGSYRTAISMKDIESLSSNNGAFPSNSSTSHSVSVACFRRFLSFSEYLRDDFFHTLVYSLLRIQDPLHPVASPKWIDVANISIIATPLICKRVSRF